MLSRTRLATRLARNVTSAVPGTTVSTSSAARFAASLASSSSSSSSFTSGAAASHSLISAPQIASRLAVTSTVTAVPCAELSFFSRLFKSKGETAAKKPDSDAAAAVAPDAATTTAANTADSAAAATKSDAIDATTATTDNKYTTTTTATGTGPATATAAATAPAAVEDDDDEWEWVPDVPAPNEAMLMGAAPNLMETFVVKPFKYKRMNPTVFLDHLPSPAGPADPIVTTAWQRNRSFVVTLSGKVFARGLGITGQLGLGPLTLYAHNYTEIKGIPAPVCKVVVAPNYTAFLTTEGMVYYTGAWRATDWLRPSARRPRFQQGVSLPTTAKVTDIVVNRLFAQVLLEDGMLYRWQTNALSNIGRKGATKPKQIKWGVTKAILEEQAKARETTAKMEEKAKSSGAKGSKTGDAGKAEKDKDGKAKTGDADGAAAAAAAVGAEAAEGDAAAAAAEGALGLDGKPLVAPKKSRDVDEEDEPQIEKAVRLMSAGKHHHGFISEDGKLYLWGLNQKGQLGHTAESTTGGRNKQIWQSLKPLACKVTATAQQYLAASHITVTLSAGKDNNMVRFGAGRSTPVMNKYLRGMDPPLRSIVIGEDNTVLVANDGSLFTSASYDLPDPIPYPGFGPDNSARYGRIVTVGEGRNPTLVVECNPAYYKFINDAKAKQELITAKTKAKGKDRVKGKILERAYAPNQALPENNPPPNM